MSRVPLCSVQPPRVCAQSFAYLHLSVLVEGAIAWSVQQRHCEKSQFFKNFLNNFVPCNFTLCDALIFRVCNLKIFNFHFVRRRVFVQFTCIFVQSRAFVLAGHRYELENQVDVEHNFSFSRIFSFSKKKGWTARRRSHTR